MSGTDTGTTVWCKWCQTNPDKATDPEKHAITDFFLGGKPPADELRMPLIDIQAGGNERVHIHGAMILNKRSLEAKMVRALLRTRHVKWRITSAPIRLINRILTTRRHHM